MKRLENRSESQQTLKPEVEGSATNSSSPDLASDLASKRPASPQNNMVGWLMKGIALGLTAVVSASVGAAIALMAPLPKEIAPQAENKPPSLTELWNRGFGYHITRPITVLVMGIDLPLDLPEDAASNDVFAGRSDTMLLLRIDPNTEEVNVLSIPRDTQVEIPGEGISKINYANVLGGSELAGRVVSQNLNGVTIDRYVRVSTGAFRELVDLLGGVRVFVPERMEYEDQTQKLKIDLEPGWQTLNGEQAEQFARFRNDANGDIGRVQRQQQLIRALREKITSPAVIARVPQAIQLFQQYIDTNLTSEEMLALAQLGLGLEQDNFRMVLLPGRFSTSDEYIASYWLMDSSGRDQVMRDYFDVRSVAVLSQQHPLNDLSIAIQNASNDPYLGSQVADLLQSQGFYNVYVIEDWPDQEQTTQIIVQGGDLRSAETLESMLGVGQVVPASTGDISSDLTIRVGNDWAEHHRI
ncbi:MAG: LCP family protein [Elainellaceae cyanobacterium]